MAFNKKTWSKQYYLKNKEKVNATVKKWRKENKEKMKIIRRRWRVKNQERNRKLANDWAKKNKEYIAHNHIIQKAKRRGAKGFHSLEEWNKVKEKFNYTCQMCNRKEPIIKLTRDHIIPINKGGANYISNIQPLCVSCNCSKGDKIN